MCGVYYIGGDGDVWREDFSVVDWDACLGHGHALHLHETLDLLILSVSLIQSKKPHLSSFSQLLPCKWVHRKYNKYNDFSVVKKSLWKHLKGKSNKNTSPAPFLNGERKIPQNPFQRRNVGKPWERRAYLPSGLIGACCTA